MVFVALFFFIIPWLAPVFEPGLRTNERFTKTNHIMTTITQRTVSPSDAARRRAEIQQWEKAGRLGERPAELKLGETFEQRTTTGGKSIFWSDGVMPVGEARFEVVSETQEGAKEKFARSAEAWADILAKGADLETAEDAI